MTVQGPRRLITDEDVVYDYGNLREWEVIPCRDGRPLPELSRGDLMAALGKPRRTPPRFLGLWRVPDRNERELLRRLLL